ncbi:MAG TPA: hypothetical protein PKA82_14930 [Pyrinomonadaceae bacterium]|mgnify:CR=1 FL=1|nr:hypothetical protein [Pyrinomonadaceae bacterium]
MKSLAPLFVVVTLAVAAAGQVTTLKNEIPASRYYNVEKKAAELLKQTNYRSIWTKEYFLDRAKPARLQERKLYEVIRPNKWRSLDESYYDKPKREEIIAVGKSFYWKYEAEEWRKGDLSDGSDFAIDAGPSASQFRYLPAVDLDGIVTEYYEEKALRADAAFATYASDILTHVRIGRSWYSADGKLLKKVVERTIEGYEELLRETTTYEYDPKDLEIEAPIK